MILIQIKIFGRNIKEATLAKYFIKVTAHPSFTRLKILRQINRVHQISKWKVSQENSVVSPSYLNLLVQWQHGIQFISALSTWHFEMKIKLTDINHNSWYNHNEVKLFARCLLLVSFCSLLVTFFSLVASLCSLVASLCSLFVSFCQLLVTFFSLLVSFCSLLASFCSLLVTFCSLLVSFCLLLVSFCCLLVSFCSLLVTFCLLLDKKF